jgi:HPt (histidine-containing phosphotransfer) domain-containing protein
VPHIDRRGLSGSKPKALDVTYEDVRQSFLIRLHSEQTRLTVLTGALGCAETDPAAAFVNLEIFAHRLRGAAAVFDVPELREAAKGLELAAAAAAVDRAPIDEPLVQTAMQTLAARLTHMNVVTPSPEVAVALTN